MAEMSSPEPVPSQSGRELGGASPDWAGDVDSLHNRLAVATHALAEAQAALAAARAKDAVAAVRRAAREDRVSDEDTEAA